MSIQKIADYFIINSESITEERVQILTYLAQSMSYKIYSIPLVITTFKAGKYPYNEDVKNRLKKYKGKQIPKSEAQYIDKDYYDSQRKLLKMTMELYGSLSDEKLFEIINSESPYIKAINTENKEIKGEDMRKFHYRSVLV